MSLIRNNGNSVVIIGAGIAGLAASSHLAKHNYDVKILEARNYSGGRICADNTLGLPISRGAGWIHGRDGNPMTELAKKVNARLVAVDPYKFQQFDGEAKLVSQNDINQFNIKFDSFLRQAKEFAFNLPSDTSLSYALNQCIKIDDLSPVELSLLKSKLISMESYVGANEESLSARNWDQEEAYLGDNCFVISTYQPIIDSLTTGANVILNTVVTNINKRQNDVEIITESSVYYADKVIVTVPLGVLKKSAIKFDPPLPSSKQQSIDRLGMGVFNISAMKFPKSFWENHCHAMLYPQLDKVSIPVFFNLHHFITEPVLLGFSGGARALTIENYTDEELIQKIITNFKNVYGNKVPEPESFFHTRWSRDRFSFGSYSYIPSGASCRDYEVIAQPVESWLYFAGEATSSKHPATTHGAYLSGIREAERILRNA